MKPLSYLKLTSSPIHSEQQICWKIGCRNSNAFIHMVKQYCLSHLSSGNRDHTSSLSAPKSYPKFAAFGVCVQLPTGTAFRTATRAS